MTKYFDVLVPADSRLRALPAALERSMRMRIDALVYSADAISNNWQILKIGAQFLGGDVNRLDNSKRVAMLSAAWSIVDELDAVRQLVSGMAEPGQPSGPKTERLLDACAVVRTLRNKMRHLAGSLQQLAGAKGSRSALFGALSWFWCPDPQSGRGHCLLLQSGMIHGGESMALVNPAGKDFTPPADLFQLDAFGQKLILSEPILAFAEWLEVSTDDWLGQIDRQIKAHVATEGGDEAAFWSHSGGAFAIALAVNIAQGEQLNESS